MGSAEDRACDNEDMGTLALSLLSSRSLDESPPLPGYRFSHLKCRKVDLPSGYLILALEMGLILGPFGTFDTKDTCLKDT